ncbi:MAG: kelch repeat-containing protein, partial [bacterium]
MKIKRYKKINFSLLRSPDPLWVVIEANKLRLARVPHKGAGLLKALLRALLSLIIVIITGCAGKAKVQVPDKALATPSPAQKPPTDVAIQPAGNGITGHTLSQWFDRTPTISPSSAWPTVAEDCAMIYDPAKHRIVLFGGKNDDNQNLNEVWTFDLARNAWQKIAVEGESPPPSEDHAVIYD